MSRRRLKHRDLVKHLTAHGCVPRNGGKHQVWTGPGGGEGILPFHTTNDVIHPFTATRVCRATGIPTPG